MIGRAAAVELALFAGALLLGVCGYGLPDFGRDDWTLRPPADSVLRVCTWNLGGSSGKAGRSFDDEHLPAVAESLRKLDADLIFVQEVSNSDQLFRLAEAIGPGLTFRLQRGYGRRVGVLAQRGALEVLEAPEAGERPLHVVYRGNNGSVVQAVALHAHAWSAERRNRSIGISLDFLEGNARSSARILCGDLNLDLDRGKRQDLFTDDEHLDIETYNYVARSLLDAGLGTGPTAEPDRRLDYVFVTPESLRVVGAGPWLGQRVGDMDHHPLVVDLEDR